MCGITFVASKNNNNILSIVINSLTQLQNRGYDSAGIAYKFQENINIIKQIKNSTQDSIEYIKNELIKEKINSNLAIAHTRWATHGGITIENTHPHYSSDNRIFLVHNGIIENYLKIKTFLLNKNYKFYSETDSEVICKLLEYNLSISKNIEKAIVETCNILEGTWGLVILFKDNMNIYLTKNGSPLLIGFNDDFIIGTSEISGFNNHIIKYINLENNNLYKIEDNIFTQIKNKDLITDFNYLYISTNELIPSLNNYNYWTEKEIFDQPISLLNALNNGGRIQNNIIKLGGLEFLKNKIHNINNIILLGCGTSYNACLIFKYYLKNLKIFNSIHVYDAAEFSELDIPLHGITCVFFCSQSGETRDLYKNISITQKYNCINIGIINVVDSLIAREVDCGIYLNAGREVAVASTKSFTSMIIIMSLISLYFTQIKNINNLNIINNIENIRNIPEQVKLLLDNKILNKISNIKDIILNKLNSNNTNTILILGNGIMYSIAREAALKIKEMSYIHAEAYQGYSLKHGPLALIEKDTCVLLIIDKINKNTMINVYEEILARGGYCIIITELGELDEFNRENTTVFNTINNYYQEIIFIVFFQYLAYLLALSKNINPDKPRNLAKVVTVQ